jgi:hypothetical protein
MSVKIQCDGCGRTPTTWEWVRAELGSNGYAEWRHPGIVFKNAGCPVELKNRHHCQEMFQVLFGRPMPDPGSYLCPQCNALAQARLPALIEERGASL